MTVHWKPNTHTHDCSLLWLATSTSITDGGIKLVLLFPPHFVKSKETSNIGETTISSIVLYGCGV